MKQIFQNKKTQFLILTLVFTVFLSGGFGCRGGNPAAKQAAQQGVELEIWSVFDSQKDLEPILTAYNKLHPNVKIQFRRYNPEEYKDMLLDAFAEDRGPDVFALPNTWIKGYVNKIAPMPESLTIPYEIVKGSIKKERVVELKTFPTPSPKSLKTKFVDVIYSDVVQPVEVEIDGKEQRVEKIVGLPLSVDALALYYNVDLLDKAGISVPAQTWEEFTNHVKKLTAFDAAGNIVQSAVSLGTGKNINRASDILSLLMLQNGTQMMNETNTAITFHQYPQDYTKERIFPPGEEALVFYTNFSNKSNEVYTWNNTLPESLEAFVSSKTAYFFGYSYHRSTIEKKAPGMNFNVTKAPVISSNSPIYFANYWIYTVSKKTEHRDWAWEFLLFMADPKNAQQYLENTKRPAAARELIDKQKQDPELQPFAEMALTAKSWYKGKDALTTEKIMKEMIESVVDGRAYSFDAIKFGAQMIQQTLY